MLGMTFKRMTRAQAKTLTVAEQHEWFQQQRSRRAVLKGGVAGAGSLLVGGTLLGQAGQAAAATVTRPATGPILLRSFTAANAPGVVPFGRHISYGLDP